LKKEKEAAKKKAEEKKAKQKAANKKADEKARKVAEKAAERGTWSKRQSNTTHNSISKKRKSTTGSLPSMPGSSITVTSSVAASVTQKAVKSLTLINVVYAIAPLLMTKEKKLV